MRDADFGFEASIGDSRSMPQLGTITLAPEKISHLIRRSRRALELGFNVGRHMRVYRALAQSEYKEIRRLQRKIYFKYLNRRYLVLGLTTSARASAQQHHYRFMKARFCDRYLKHHLVSGVPLWTHETSEGCHELSLSFSHPCDNEGELTLFYNFAGACIARASFTFVPAGIVGNTGQSSLLLTRIQGEKNVHEHIRSARKSLHGLDGPTALVASLAGMAHALDMSLLTVVTAEAQVSRNDTNFGTLSAAYDGFFTSLGVDEADDKFMKISLPLLEKPLSEVKSSNRKKVSLQREAKNLIRSSTIQQFQSVVLKSRENRSN